MIKILLFVVGLPIALWFLFCAAIWIYYFIAGHKKDHSGDGGLAVLCLPFIPLIWLLEKLKLK